MILDEMNIFMKEQDDGTVATHNSADVIDLFALGDAEVKKARLHIRVDESVTATGAATVNFTLETADNVAFNAGEKDLWQSGAIGKADLVAGKQVCGKGGLPLPSGCRRYLRVKYAVATSALTAGKFTAFLTFDADTNYGGDFT